MLTWFWKLEPRDRAELFFSLIIACATTVYVIIAAFQLSGLDRTLKQTKRAVRATQQQVAVGKEANKIARNALVSGERPWVGVVKIGELKHYSIGGIPTAQIKTRISGRLRRSTSG